MLINLLVGFEIEVWRDYIFKFFLKSVPVSFIELISGFNRNLDWISRDPSYDRDVIRTSERAFLKVNVVEGRPIA